jgi:amino acid adenylation domain-containing protein
LSAAKRDLLEKYLRGELKQHTELPLRIEPRLSGNSAQLSFAQERLWFLDQLNAGSAVYNVPLAVRLSDPIDPAILEQSVNEIMQRHEALRTTFQTVDGQPIPIIRPDLFVDLPTIDLTSEPKPDRAARAHSLLSAEATRPFDLAQGPLIRTLLIRLDRHEHIFLVVMHHIVSDGWSLVLFFRELSAIYATLACGEQSSPAQLSIQYADYAAWQRARLKGVVFQRQLDYWKEKLAGELPVLDLPTDRRRTAEQTFAGARASLTLSEKLTASIAALAQRQGVTVFIALLAAFKVLLFRHTEQADIIVGSPISNRPQVETESLIGFFLNNLALRSDLSGNPSFREVVARVRRTALEAYANQDIPFEKLIEVLKPVRSLSRPPIFQVYFNLFNFAAEIPLPGSDKTVSFFEAWERLDEHVSKFDLTLYAGQHGRQLKLALVYNTDLFGAGSIQRMLAQFQTLLTGVVANPDQHIAEFSLGSQTEAFQSNRVRPNKKFIEFSRDEIDQSIAARFVKQAGTYPERIAVKSPAHEWSYGELDRFSNAIAQSILRDIGPGDERIALLFEHEAPMIAGILGALKAGKTYVPLDPLHPAERLVKIVEHSEATALLTNSKNLARARELITNDLRLINIDTIIEDADPLPLPVIEPDRLAYILYTSGSTGQPKGVMQNQRNVLHHARVYTNNLHLDANDRLTLLSSYCFDAAVMDIFGALLNGATLCPIDIREEGLNALRQRLSDEGITVYHSTPTVYRYFANPLESGTDLRSIRLVVLGGEEVNRQDVEFYQKYFSDECLFVNGLGPTEATVSLQNFSDKQSQVISETVPVGFPVEDTEVLLLNDSGQLSEVYGEIAIKSPHVALGYWRNPEATAAAFSVSPNVNGGSVRIYRTGDMGRRLPDGSIKFEGRKDFQVKIRGFRIELGEIESALKQHAQVSESVVVMKENAAGDKRLVAYVVPHGNGVPITTGSPNGRGAEAAELRDFLARKLPDYLVPSSFVWLDALPLTASGKIHRRALPAPGYEQNTRSLSSRPQTQTEKELAMMWSDLLSISEMGIDDNFFELGGHSLLAVRLFAQIEKRFGRRLPLATLFQAPTIAQLATIIDKDLPNARAAEWSSLVPIQPEGSRPPFFCVHALGGNVLEYYDLANYLGRTQPFYGLQSAGLNGKQAPHARVEDMAAHYLREMRELQPQGPYFIGGRSLGGMIAFEMAQQLRVQGEEIGLLALLDTYPSGYAKLLSDQKTLRARFSRAAGRTKAHLANLRSLSLKDKLLYLAAKSKFAPRKMKSHVWRGAYSSFANLGRPLPRALQDIKELNSVAVREYVPQIYDGHVTLFWASSDLRASVDFVEGWRALAGGGIEVHEIPGSHLDIVKEPHVGELAAKLRSCLRDSTFVLPGPVAIFKT